MTRTGTAPAPPDAFAPTQLGAVQLRNRILKAATFEGMTGRRVVEDRLVEFHRTMARGGVAMTTLGFCAVSPDGAATPNELVLSKQRIGDLARLADIVHGEGAAVSAQIGHAGAVAAATGHRGVSASRFFSPVAMARTREASSDDIARITTDFVNAAETLVEAGFDAVEVHLGHGYLLSQFLSPKLNRRGDQWGGSLENRARFSRDVLKSVRDAVGSKLGIVAKLNLSDGVAGGFWVDECVAVARMLEADGVVDAIELTGGSSLENPMYLFRGEAPIHEMAMAMPGPVRLGIRFFGRFVLKEYPFEEAYFLKYARQVRAAVRLPLILLGGVSRLETIEAAMAEGFEFVAMGRALLREPDLVRRYAEGSVRESLCVHCNKCMPTIYRGTHCVLA